MLAKAKDLNVYINEDSRWVVGGGGWWVVVVVGGGGGGGWWVVVVPKWWGGGWCWVMIVVSTKYLTLDFILPSKSFMSTRIVEALVLNTMGH